MRIKSIQPIAQFWFELAHFSFPPRVPIMLQFPSSTIACIRIAVVAGFIFSFHAPVVHGVTITRGIYSNHTHGGSAEDPTSPFFTQAVNVADGTVFNYGATQGLSGSVAATGTTSTGAATLISGRVNIVGSATSKGADGLPNTADDWLNGPHFPAGISLSFDVTFTISSSSGKKLVLAGGNLGLGLGIANDNLEAYGEINVGEVLQISQITTSNHQWSGVPNEAFTFTPISIGVTAMEGFRSNNFLESAAGATLSDGLDTWGFGISTGTRRSHLIMDNHFGRSAFSPYAGGNVPLTLTTDAGAWNLKGFSLATLVTYEIVPIAPPADFDGDSDVDGADFLRWQRNVGLTGVDPTQGDADGSGTVDGVDLVKWRAQFGPHASAVAVPEPGCLILALTALLAGRRPAAWRLGL
jgi:hypothetical protein